MCRRRVSSNGSYEFFFDKYDEQQKLLESTHIYEWINGSLDHDDIFENEKIFLTEAEKNFIRSKSFVELFKILFSEELKQYIIDAIFENNYELSKDKLDAFLSILITTSFNTRKRERDYWSNDKIIHHDLIASTMSRNEYLDIKRFFLTYIYKKLV